MLETHNLVDIGARHSEAREELARLLSSRVFSGSERLRNFLKYITDFALEHPGASLKEVQLGVDLYKISDYDPKTAATVRVDAGRLRQKLMQYYATEGAASPVRLELPPGSYIPQIRLLEQPPALVKGRTRKLWFAAAAALVAIAAAGYLLIPASTSSTSLAVLPIANRSGDPSLDAVAQRLSATIARTLEHHGKVSVIPLLDAADRSRQGHTPDTMLRRLRGSVLLESTLTRHGSEYRAQLYARDLDRGVQLWSGMVEAPVTSEETLENRIVDLVERNSTQLSAPPAQPSTIGPANRAYSEARYKRILEADGSLPDIERLLRQAVDADPSFAAAWALLADTTLRRVEKERRTRRGNYEEAAEMCRRAIALDPRNVLALETLGNVLLYHLWKFPEAVRVLRNVLEVEPGNQRARRQLAEALTLAGQFEEALDVARGYGDSGAFTAYLELQTVLTVQARRDYTTSLNVAREFAAKYPDFHLAHWAFGNQLRAVGNVDAAASEFRECLRLSANKELRCRISVAVVEARAGRTEQTRRLLSNFDDIREQHGFGANVIRAILLTSVGQEDQAIGHLLQAATLADPDLAFLWLEPQLDPIRDHPRFPELEKWVPRPASTR